MYIYKRSSSRKNENFSFFCIYFQFPFFAVFSKKENLSPFLFALFLSDLQSFLEKENIPGLKTISEKIEENLNIYLKLFVLLYADDNFYFRSI
jgi:hypothetical protein